MRNEAEKCLLDAATYPSANQLERNGEAQEIGKTQLSKKPFSYLCGQTKFKTKQKITSKFFLAI